MTTVSLTVPGDEAAEIATTLVEQKVKELHPYEVPCIERSETDEVNEACAEWLG